METADVIEKLKEMKSMGISYKYIANVLGIHTYDIYNYLRNTSPCNKTHELLVEYLKNKGE